MPACGLYRVDEPLKGCAIEEVLARVDFVADIAAHVVIGVENGLPPFGEFRKGRFNHTRWPLRPRIDIGPSERAGERDRRLKPEMLGGRRRQHQLLDRPSLPRLRLAMDFRWRKGIKRLVKGRVDRNQLALQMGR
jgi:hypothetical protein